MTLRMLFDQETLTAGATIPAISLEAMTKEQNFSHQFQSMLLAGRLCQAVAALTHQWSFRIKQEQWERWRTKRKLMSGSKHRGRFCGYGDITPLKIEILFAKSFNIMHFGSEIGSKCRP